MNMFKSEAQSYQQIRCLWKSRIKYSNQLMTMIKWELKHKTNHPTLFVNNAFDSQGNKYCNKAIHSENYGRKRIIECRRDISLHTNLLAKFKVKN